MEFKFDIFFVMEFPSQLFVDTLGKFYCRYYGHTGHRAMPKIRVPDSNMLVFIETEWNFFLLDLKKIFGFFIRKY